MGCAASASPDVMAERNLTATLEIMFDAYGKPTEQVGYTDGHYCITPDDKAIATLSCSSLLYGEVLPAGITKLLSSDYLGACRAQVLFDLGMGVGKFVLQAFLQYPNLKYVCGVELAASRFNLAEQALLRMASLQPELLQVDSSVSVDGRLVRVHTLGRKFRRTIELRRGDMWKQARDLGAADIVVMHTDVPPSCTHQFRRAIAALKPGARFVTYQDLFKMWRPDVEPPFEQLAVNVSESDTFLTSWSSERGYHLYCWEKTVYTPYVLSPTIAEECKEAMTEPAEGDRNKTFMHTHSKGVSHQDSLVLESTASD